MSTLIFINNSMKRFMALFLLCGCVNSNSYQQPFVENQYVYTASTMLGLDEKVNRKELRNFLGVDPVYYEWCAAFVNASLHIHDIPGSDYVSEHPLMARSFMKWGEPVTDEQLKKGDVIVFPRGNTGWQGHVGFYVRTQYVNGIKYYLILGGNQDDKVSYELYPAAKAIALRRWKVETE